MAEHARRGLPRRVWVYTGFGLYCFAVVVAKVQTLLEGGATASIWWALPLNVLLTLWYWRMVRRLVRRHALPVEQLRAEDDAARERRWQRAERRRERRERRKEGWI